MMSIEQIEDNPFYHKLQTKFASQFLDAQNKRCVICIPAAVSLRGLKEFTHTFFESHILKPSPYFLDQLTSTGKYQQQTYELKNNLLELVDNVDITLKCFKIISRELGYNKAGDTFQIFVLDKPLTGDCVKPNNGDRSLRSRLYDLDLQNAPCELKADICNVFLHEENELFDVIDKLDKEIHLMKTSYVFLPKFVKDARDKCERISDDFVKTVCGMLAAKPYSTTENIVKELIGTYVVGCLQNELYAIIYRFCKDDDGLLADRFSRLNQLDDSSLFAEFDIKMDFRILPSKAISELSTLNNRASLSEKLFCLNRTFHLVQEEVNSYISEQFRLVKSTDQLPSLTSDEFIPLLIIVIARSRVQSLASDLYFVDNFIWHLSPIDIQRYSLVTFHAATEYARSEAIDSILKKITICNDSISFQSEQNSSHFVDDKSISDVVNKLDINTDLDHITRTLEVASLEFCELPPNFNGKKESLPDSKPLGGFLSKLRSDALGMGFGKQT